MAAAGDYPNATLSIGMAYDDGGEFDTRVHGGGLWYNTR